MINACYCEERGLLAGDTVNEIPRVPLTHVCRRVQNRSESMTMPKGQSQQHETPAKSINFYTARSPF